MFAATGPQKYGYYYFFHYVTQIWNSAILQLFFHITGKKLSILMTQEV